MAIEKFEGSFDQQAKAAVRLAFDRAGITKTELARRLYITEKQARRILDPRLRTHIDTLGLAAEVMGFRLIVGLEEPADAAQDKNRSL